MEYRHKSMGTNGTIQTGRNEKNRLSFCNLEGLN
jgi:hypothetical protein